LVNSWIQDLNGRDQTQVQRLVAMTETTDLIWSEMPGREFAWTGADFERVQAMIYQRAGISLHDGKHAMVYSRLSRRLRETGYRSFYDYLSWVESSDGPEWQEFINSLTTNLTSFFRENHHFEILFDVLRAGQANTSWNIWCAAASTGEEPYSIAMTAVNALGSNANVSILATDIDSKVLATASQGIYRLDALKGTDPADLQHFFLRGKGRNSGLAKVQRNLREMITFSIFNLIDEGWHLGKSFDVVFCRNVMIYFNSRTQRKVLEGIHGAMSPGGLLFVGHAENFNDSRDLFALKGRTVYERR
jgi:chemotaxis protein methyltransferase CheR